MQLSRDKASSVDGEDSALGKSLALLRVAEKELAVEGMSAPQIATVLNDKFRWRVTRQAIGQALDRAGRMVESRKVGAARVFRLMSDGEAWLDTAADQRAKTRTSRGASAKRKSPAKMSPAKKSPAKKGPASARRVGPKAALQKLISTGYFAQPRTISAMRSKLEEESALIFKATDLSPTLVRLLREGVLARSKNEDGQYEYAAPGA
jgi:hypothetical protein